jgi:hypothetical protein
VSRDQESRKISCSLFFLLSLRVRSSGRTTTTRHSANPFGVEWKPQTDVIEREHDEQGFKGHVPRNQAKWSFRRISSKLLKRLVAARGLEPRTYGL